MSNKRRAKPSSFRRHRDALIDWKGRCYEAAVHFQFINPEAKVVHGIPTGIGGNAAGQRYGHAWCEYGNYVFDLTVSASPIPKADYYALGNIDPAECVSYSVEEVKQNLREKDSYGPWAAHIHEVEHL